MKTIVLNLPNKNQVVRRYMCSYNAPNFLYPPLELMYISAIVKEWKKDDVILIDDIAEKLNIEEVINKIKEFNAFRWKSAIDFAQTIRKDIACIQIKRHSSKR